MAEREEITVAQLAAAKKGGLDYILDNVEVKGTAVIRDKDGNIKGELELTELKEES